MVKRRIGIAGVATALVLGIAACGGGESANDAAQRQANANGENFQPYVPPENNAEQRNYNFAQQFYNDPASILWCTAFPASNTAPIVTFPVSGKLTSSTTTAFPPDYAKDMSHGAPALTNRSVDGLYHPNPPQYRYGQTPGGQLVDTNMDTFCTSKPMEFQRQSVEVKVDTSLASASSKAEAALKAGDKDKAQQILEQAAGQ